jgi:hypothetical protein
MSGGGAPTPDPAMGEAAKLSAQTGQDMLEFMTGQAEVTNRWADEDRTRYQEDYVPRERAYAARADAARDPAKIGLNADNRASEAVGDVRQQFALQRDSDDRRSRSMGVRPDSGRDAAMAGARGSAEALSSAGASNMARRQSIMQDDAKAETMTTNSINMGKGMAVNPGTSMGLSNASGQAGFSGAMGGYGQQANILGKEFDGRMDGWKAKQAQYAAFGQALGSVAGAWG